MRIGCNRSFAIAELYTIVMTYLRSEPSMIVLYMTLAELVTGFSSPVYVLDSRSGAAVYVIGANYF